MLIALALSALATSAPGDAEKELYERAKAKALERAQAELLESLDLWVDHSRWEDPWVVESAHYSVRGTKSHAMVAKAAQDLEYLFGEFQRVLGTEYAPAQRFQVWIFPTLADYNQFGNDANADEHSSMYAAFYAAQAPGSPVVACFNDHPTLLGMYITHGATHQFLESAFGTRMPVWIAEGLASYFALYWDWSYGAQQLEGLIGGSGFVPLAQLTRATLPEYLAGAHDRFIELGMLFHYLLNLREDTKIGAGGDPTTGPFLEYVRAILRGRSVAQLDVAPLLAEDLDILEADFKAFEFAK